MVTGGLIEKNTPEGYKKFITEGLIEIEIQLTFYSFFGVKAIYMPLMPIMGLY